MDSVTQLEDVLSKWEKDLVEYLPKIALAIVVLIVFFGLAKIIRKWSYKAYFKSSNSSKRRIAKAISLVFYFFFVTSGTFLALEVLGLESVLTKLLAGAGIVGVIAGFAFKDIASNAFSGFLLSIQRPFKQGDWVQIGDHFGAIDKIGLISTAIKTVPGQKVYVPNQLVYNNAFTNFSFNHKRRVILNSGVSYGDDLEKVKAVALDEVKKVDLMLKDQPINFFFTGIGDSTYNFEVRFWIIFHKEEDYMEAMSELIVRIKKRFEQEDICIAYSVTTLDFGVKGGVNLFDTPVQVQTPVAVN